MIAVLLLAAALTADQADAIVQAAARMTAARQPQWLTDFDKAEALSLRTGRPLLAFCTIPGCQPCRAFEAWQATTDLSGWVLLRVEVSAINNPLRVAYAPTHVIRVNGRELGRWQGLGEIQSAADYQRWLLSQRTLASKQRPHR